MKISYFNQTIKSTPALLAGALGLLLSVSSCTRTVYVDRYNAPETTAQAPASQYDANEEQYTTQAPVQVTPPDWAPQYDYTQSIHYYYIPDLEMYYDVWNHQYVYLDNGAWMFTPYLPTPYANYDMRTAYVVVLNRSVYQPWYHHNIYESHYPRYYYRSKYDDPYNGNTSNYSGPRGFNENSKKPIYPNGSTGSNRTTNVPSNNNTKNVPNNNTTNRPNNGTSNTPTAPSTTPSSPSNNTQQPGRNMPSNPSNTGNSGTTSPNTNRPAPTVQPTQQKPVENTRNSTTPTSTTPAPTQTPRQVPATYNNRSVGEPVKVQRNMTAPRPTQQPAQRTNTQPSQRSAQPAQRSAAPTRQAAPAQKAPATTSPTHNR